MPNDPAPLDATEIENDDARLEELTTEAVNAGGADLDLRTTEALVAAMHREDLIVPQAIAGASASIAEAIDAIAERMSRGGRLFYVGAGTPGRIGILDASEAPPTFGTSPDQIVGIIAGGRSAVFESVENAEDDPEAGAEDLGALDLSALDSVVGLSASGRTPYVVGALEYAEQRGALTVALSCNDDSLIGHIARIAIEVVVGPEFLSGSTRLKAGSAQKAVLNMISTIVMIKLGKTYGNLMIDLKATNHKLRARAERTVARITSAEHAAAKDALERTGYSVKEAALILAHGIGPEEARDLLGRHGGDFRAALESARTSN